MRDFLKKFITSVVVVIFMAAFSLRFPQPTIFHYIALLFVILLFYYVGLPALSMLWKWIKEKKRRNFPKIGILNGNIESPVREYKCQHAHTDVTAGMWFLRLKQEMEKRKIEMITTSKINDSFSLIINPFGDNFPEEDQKLHTTFYKICKFIENGGFFVCTGGAFWSHQNTKISDVAEWVFVKTLEGKQSLKDSFLYNEFGILPTGEVWSGPQIVVQEPLEIEAYQKDEDKAHIGTLLEGNARIKRFRALTPESSNYIPLLREQGDKSFPISAIPYGKGYLVHAGMRLTGIDSMEFDILIKVIRDIVNNKFKNF